ncbi:MAG: hypothetical protein ACOCX5_03665 [Chloroflexota bacterium]
MQSEFIKKLLRIRQQVDSEMILLLSPVVTRMPLPIRRYDDPFLPFGKAIIQATHDLVCGYCFDVPAYLAIGAAGAIALERTLSYVAGERLTILHGPFAGPAFARLTDENAFDSDAVTLIDAANLSAYLYRPDRSAFVSVTGTPEAAYVDALCRQGGIFWARAAEGDGHLSYGRFVTMTPTGTLVTLWLAGEEVLYAASGDDFTEHVRNALMAMKVNLSNG